MPHTRWCRCRPFLGRPHSPATRAPGCAISRALVRIAKNEDERRQHDEPAPAPGRSRLPNGSTPRGSWRSASSPPSLPRPRGSSYPQAQPAARASSSSRSRALRGQRRRPLELRGASSQAPEPRQQVAAHAGQQVVVGASAGSPPARRPAPGPPPGPNAIADRDRAVELHHRRRRDAARARRTARRSAPSRCPPPCAPGRGRRRSRPAARTGPRAPPQRLGARQRREPAPDQQPVPARAVLVQQQHRLAVRADARAQPRRLQLHQRHQPVHLRLVAAPARRACAPAAARPRTAPAASSRRPRSPSSPR